MNERKPVLAQVRRVLLEMGASEMQETRDDEMLQSLFDQIQDLRREMNEAKKEAAARAAQPYLNAIEQVEKRYAMYLRLKGQSTRNDK